MQLSSKSFYIYLFLLFVSYFIISFDIGLITFAYAISFFVIYQFIQKLGNQLDFKTVILFIAALQWIMGPALAYSFLHEWDYYYMAVSAQAYYTFVLPSFLLLAAGLYLPLKQQDDDLKLIYNAEQFLHNKGKLGLVLFLIGMVADLFSFSLPPSLRFLFYLITGLKFVGVYYIYYSNIKGKYIYLGIAFAAVVASALASALFHDIFLWAVMTVVLLAPKFKPSLALKFSVITIGMLFALVLQSIKTDYRAAVWFGEVSDGKGLFVDLFQSRLESKSFLDERNLNQSIYRINQGWIIARTMSHTPFVQPFADGETIVTGIKASLVPRLFNPDKYVAGGREYFTRFSGLMLYGDTSMNLSVPGESYANYGVIGGALFMFVFGLFFNFILANMFNFSESRPTLFLWIPFVFLQAIKAETDFTTVVNYVTKAVFFTFFVYFFCENFLKKRI